jgi:hypothetical protein
MRPVLPPEVPQFFIPLRSHPPGASAKLVYRPMLLGCGNVYFTDVKTGVDQQEELCLIAPLAEDAAAAGTAVDWPSAAEVGMDDADLEREPATDVPASYAPLPGVAGKPKNYDTWSKRFADALYRGRSIELLRSPTYKQTSKPGETPDAFRARLAQFARERRDAELEKLRIKFAPKFQVLEDKIRRADQAVAREREQASASKWNTAISIGSTILGAFLGRKTISAGTVGRATTAARGASRSYKESQDVNRAGETVEAAKQQLADLEAELDVEKKDIAARTDVNAEQLETVALKPKKSGITVKCLVLAWAPHWQDGTTMTPAF